jgi:hypothetical protein
MGLLVLGAAHGEGVRLFAWRSTHSIKQKEADQALRETLRIAIAGATAALEAPNAFSAKKRHIDLPEPLASMRGDWNAVGRSGALERLETAMNLAAESAVPQAGSTVLGEAATVDFYDPVAVVMSGDQAASRMLALRSRARLEQKLGPLLEQSLARSGAFAALADAAQAAGQPEKSGDYRVVIVRRTMAGLLDAIFAETCRIEGEIRAEPAGRGSPVLEQVFSAVPTGVREVGAGG